MSAVPESDELLLREENDGVCTLTMNRPQHMNLLTGEMLAALQSAATFRFDGNRLELRRADGTAVVMLIRIQ